MVIAVTTIITAVITPRSLFVTSLISSLPQSQFFLKNPSLRPSFNLRFQAPPFISPMASFITAEYAKSGRSSCKTCSDNIAHKTLRLGVVTKDKIRGYDLTSWHHFYCFSFDYCSVSSPESVQGFNSLKSDDQEAIKKLVEEHGKVKGRDEEAIAEDKEESTKKRKSRDRDEDDVGKKQKSPMNLQFSVTEQHKVKIALQPSDLKDSYKDAILLPKWKAFQTVIFLEKDDGLKDTSKIAAFDFDGCLAKTDVKRTGADAWELMYPSIPDKLQEMYNNGYKIVIFTNESNISRWKNQRQKAVDSKVGRLNNFIKLVKVPIQVFIACGYGPNDPYRKPKIGMWLVMEQHFNSGIPVDMNKSFYVGDAAGRKNDHSAADIDFAKGVGLKFYVPEEFFVE